MELLAEAMPSVGAAVDVCLGEAIDTGRVAARVRQYHIQTRAYSARIAHESIPALVSLWGLRQRMLRQLLWDCQDVCRVHGDP